MSLVVPAWTRPFVIACWLILCVASVSGRPASAQALGQPDRGQPGDETIQAWLAAEARRLDGHFAQDVVSREDFVQKRAGWREEYLTMLGLSPLPERTPLHATITGTLDQGDYLVDCLHYQSRPQLYVTANIYRPKTTKPGEKLPAVLYVCGHAGRGRDGCKTAYQSNAIWLARHGYVCLIVDTLQLGEIAAIHHGTYREQRWWWHSRGYTSAGVECWNGVRGIDYLISRDDVDPARIGVTGISGGGAATFWIAAADERVACAVPISGMSDLDAYVGNRVINGHCDCMFVHNSFAWPWTRIAELVAPRPLLFVNSDNDAIFPMDGNERIANRMERCYSLFGAGDRYDTLVSVGGHAYREDIRRGVFQFLNLHLKQDGRPVTDSEIDLVIKEGNNAIHPIPPERLRAFKTDADIPADQLNTTIDEHFVPLGQPGLPNDGGFAEWKSGLLAKLKRLSFHSFPERIPATDVAVLNGADLGQFVRTDIPSSFPVDVAMIQRTAEPKRVRLIVSLEQADEIPDGLSDESVYVVRPRGVGSTRWTQKNPPNYVERSHVLVGRTVDAERVREIIAVARAIKNAHRYLPLVISGDGAAGVLGAYAALWEADIDEVELKLPPLTHQSNDAPQFLNVLRVTDVPAVLGMLAPRKLTIRGLTPAHLEATKQIYVAAGAADKLILEGR